VWLPALCRKMGVPFAIIKGKARLGKLVNQKTATCVALVDVNKEDSAAFAKLSQLMKETFNEQAIELQKQWGGQRVGKKARAKAAKKAQDRR
jgi:large subunit ribosomal protein L7Ae